MLCPADPNALLQGLLTSSCISHIQKPLPCAGQKEDCQAVRLAGYLGSATESDVGLRCSFPLSEGKELSHGAPTGGASNTSVGTRKDYSTMMHDVLLMNT